jgi:hypothetical protein
LAEALEAGGHNCGGILLFEDWGEDGEGGGVCGGFGYFSCRVTGVGDQRISW